MTIPMTAGIGSPSPSSELKTSMHILDTPADAAPASPYGERKLGPTSREDGPLEPAKGVAPVNKRYQATVGANDQHAVNHARKSQLNPFSSAFLPSGPGQGLPDLAELSIKDPGHDPTTVNREPSTPKKNKDVWSFDTPRRSGSGRDQCSPTPAMTQSSFTPPSGRSAQQPYTPHTPHEPFRRDSDGYHDDKKSSLFGVAEETAEEVGRYLLIGNLPRDAHEMSVRDMIQSIAEFKAMIVKHLRSKGYVIIVFHDSREASKLFRKLHSSAIAVDSTSPQLQLHCMKVEKSIVQSIFKHQEGWEQISRNSEAVVRVEIEGGIGVSRDAMQGVMSAIGDLQRLDPVGHQGRVFIAEFCDTRAASQAIILLNGQKAGEARLHLNYLYDASGVVHGPSETYTLGSAAYKRDSFQRGPTSRARTSSTASDLFGYSTSNVGTNSTQLQTPTTSVSGRLQAEPDLFSPSSASSAYSINRLSMASIPSQPSGIWETASKSDWHADHDAPARLLALRRRLDEPGTIQGLANNADIEARARQNQGLGGHWNVHDRKAIPAHNRVFPERILSGLDRRTTVMIKDVPNKLSRQELVDILNEVVPRDYDFVGYAFVNFCSVRALYQFIQAKVGKKWNMFSSEKVLQVSYADIQGKAALINKFRNSAVMGVIEPWRPEIFYSSGAMKGLPEPFPDSDNLAIRQRSTAAQLSGSANSAMLPYGPDDNRYYDYAPSSSSAFGI
ncbi:hypothetical protein IAU60_002121 [Kwoniella sp. DSM 27419]